MTISKGQVISKSGPGKKIGRRAPHCVRDLMKPRVIAVTGVTFLPEAARIMKEEDIGALPVIKEDGTLIGILTDRDIAVRAVAADLEVRVTQVGEICTSDDVLSVSPDTSLEQAEKLMSEHQVRRLPIVEGKNHLVGVLSLADLIHQERARNWHDVVEGVCKPGGEHTQVYENLPQ
ncbi:MAG: CBS domain-containing protein [Candidatus Sericytochromatia bacterium]|nr:CBS domain-containing protein [Candidatus Sericytochromatia bacterium]